MDDVGAVRRPIDLVDLVLLHHFLRAIQQVLHGYDDDDNDDEALSCC